MTVDDLIDLLHVLNLAVGGMGVSVSTVPNGAVCLSDSRTPAANVIQVQFPLWQAILIVCLGHIQLALKPQLMPIRAFSAFVSKGILCAAPSVQI
jgi:hypothetical protein